MVTGPQTEKPQVQVGRGRGPLTPAVSCSHTAQAYSIRLVPTIMIAAGGAVGWGCAFAGRPECSVPSQALLEPVLWPISGTQAAQAGTAELSVRPQQSGVVMCTSSCQGPVCCPLSLLGQGWAVAKHSMKVAY